MWIKPNVPQLNREHPLALGLVSAYSFSERGGLTAYDLGPAKYNGTLTNFVLSTGWSAVGPFGTALDFNSAATDYVALGSRAVLDYTKPFTIAGIALAISNTESSIFVMSRSSSNSPFVRVFTLNGLLYFGARNDSESFESYNNSAAITNNRWFTFVCVREATNLIVYLNGRRFSSAITVPTTGITLDTSNIGAMIRPAPVYSGGQIAGLVLAQRAWTPGEAVEYCRDPWALFRAPFADPQWGLVSAQTVTASVGTAEWFGVEPGVVFGGVTATPEPAAATWHGLAPTVQRARNILVDSAVAWWRTFHVTVSGGDREGGGYNWGWLRRRRRSGR